MGNARRIPNTDSESEVRSAFQRLDSDVTTLEDGTISVDVIAVVGSLIVKDSDVTVKSYTEFSQGTVNQVLVSAGVGVIPTWTTDLNGLTLLTVDNITINGAVITSDTGAISFGDENLTTTGTITGGKAIIFSPTPILVFQDSNSSGAASIGYIEWKDSGGGRAGFLGNSSSGDDDLHWKNEQGGHIKIETTGAGECQIFANVDLGSNNFITTGTLGAGATTVTSLTDGTASLTGGSLTAVKLGTLTTNGFVKTSGADGTLSVDTSTYLTEESDTLDTVSDRGATTDQTLIAGGFTTTGVVTVGAAADMVITVGSITSVSGAISFGDENLSTSGKMSVGSGSTVYANSVFEVAGLFTAGKYYSALHIRAPSQSYGMFLGSISSNSGMIQAGCHYQVSETYRARATDANVIALTGSTGIRFICNTGLTPGNIYAGTTRATININGLTVVGLVGCDNLQVDNININGAVITSDTGAISFGDDIVLSDAEFIVLDKASGNGIKVDAATPTFPWRDLTGAVVVKATGAGRPTFAIYKGNIEEYQFAVNDKAEFTYHIPHDYVPGSDILLHVHWSHISASVTGGTVTFGYELTYAKGHNQSPFGANKTGTIAGTASAVQYQHIVSEVQISASSPSASQIDSDDLEPDGLILVELFFNANNMTGATPDPFVHEMDVHYQSMNIGTKQNAPDFYT